MSPSTSMRSQRRTDNRWPPMPPPVHPRARDSSRFTPGEYDYTHGGANPLGITVPDSPTRSRASSVASIPAGEMTSLFDECWRTIGSPDFVTANQVYDLMEILENVVGAPFFFTLDDEIAAALDATVRKGHLYTRDEALAVLTEVLCDVRVLDYDSHRYYGSQANVDHRQRPIEHFVDSSHRVLGAEEVSPVLVGRATFEPMAHLFHPEPSADATLVNSREPDEVNPDDPATVPLSSSVSPWDPAATSVSWSPSPPESLGSMDELEMSPKIEACQYEPHSDYTPFEQDTPELYRVVSPTFGTNHRRHPLYPFVAHETPQSAASYPESAMDSIDDDPLPSLVSVEEVEVVEQQHARRVSQPVQLVEVPTPDVSSHGYGTDPSPMVGYYPRASPAPCLSDPDFAPPYALPYAPPFASSRFDTVSVSMSSPDISDDDLDGFSGSDVPDSLMETPPAPSGHRRALSSPTTEVSFERILGSVSSSPKQRLHSARLRANHAMLKAVPRSVSDSGPTIASMMDSLAEDYHYLSLQSSSAEWEANHLKVASKLQLHALDTLATRSRDLEGRVDRLHQRVKLLKAAHAPGSGDSGQVAVEPEKTMPAASGSAWVWFSLAAVLVAYYCLPRGPTLAFDE
ncbi:hypothetical protein DICA4_E17744 [Diutina catenulata]